ncbi:MAG: hypothetical protein GY696_38445 [Gammaproteobacteria bacterium]|nr:hypothetical protein [Gammaproteobacteria bacterium]
MALVCILIFFGTTAANVLTIIVAAVKAGPTVAAGVGQRPMTTTVMHSGSPCRSIRIAAWRNLELR